MTLASLLSDISVLSIFLLVGFVILQFLKPLQKAFIPASVIGGVVALVCGPQVLNLVEIPSSFSGMSSVLINVIACSAVFGATINRSKLRSYGDFICIYIVTYGFQMLISPIIGAVCEKFWPSLPHGWGIMALYSFWGGHGTAAAAGAVFEQLGIEGNTQMGMILSTIGLISAIVVGMAIVNQGVRKGYTQKVSLDSADSIKGIVPEEKRNSIGMERVSSIAVNNLMFQTSLVMLCIWSGGKMMALLARVVPTVAAFPTMINGILGALILWPIMQKTGLGEYVDKHTINTISGFCLEFVIVSAVATIKLSMLADFIVPIIIMSAVIIAGSFGLSILYTKKISQQDWFEKGIGSFGQSNGSVPTGLALIRCVDPNTETSAAEAMGIANSVTSPMYSTMSAIGPMILINSFWVFTGAGLAIFMIPFIIGLIVFAKK